MDKDFILKFVLNHGGIKPLKSGAYKEEMRELKYPYYSNKGLAVDVMVKCIEEETNIIMTESELIDKIIAGLYSQRNNKKKG